MLSEDKTSDPGPGSFLHVGESKRAIYLEGGFPKHKPDSKISAVSFMMMVDDAPSAFAELKRHGVQIVQERPYDMGNGSFWFQFFDPSGNLLEMVSTGE